MASDAESADIDTISGEIRQHRLIMLRPLLRALPRRHFSTSSSLWITQRAVPDQPNDGEPPAKLDSAPDSVSTTKYNDGQEADATRLHTQSTSNASSSSSAPAGPHARDEVKSAAALQLEEFRQHLQDWAAKASILLRNKADDFTDATKKNFAQLGAQLNHVTGYEEIEALKRGVVEQEHRISIARQASRTAKIAFEEAALQRSTSQREVNDLLQRKSSWTDGDVGRFTALVRQDHLHEQAAQRAKAAVDATEAAVEAAFSALMRQILARYHEEQVWSDKIRSASTYGSLAALGLNMLVFIVAIVAVEPWKRRRLAQTFERKIEELSRENELRLAESMAAIRQQIDGQRLLLENIKEETATKREVIVPLPVPSVQQPVVSTEPAKPSEEVVTIHHWKVPRQHLEMAAVGAGAFAVGIISNLLLGR